jgi:glycosyltransferase involved in cell wall biosynthesis
MKVMMVTPYYFPTTIGGTEALIENISIKLNDIGILTNVLTFNLDKNKVKETLNINNLVVIRIPANDSGKMKYISQIKFFPHSFTDDIKDFDILHFHNDVDLSFPAFSFFVNKPKIFHCHCLDTTYEYYKKRYLSRNIFKHIADKYIALSDFHVKLLTDIGIPGDKIVVLPNGIDVNKFIPNNNVKENNLIIFVGRIAPKKNIPILLESLKYLKSKVNLVLIGPLTSRKEYSDKILKLIKTTDEKSHHNISYLGVQKIDDLIQWYQKATIFVLPSRSESFPLVNMEALSCETPVVATDVGGISEVVLHNKNGVLVEPNDAKKLAEGLQYLLDNEDIRKKFGRTGRKYIVENYSSENTVKKLCDIYNELI